MTRLPSGPGEKPITSELWRHVAVVHVTTVILVIVSLLTVGCGADSDPAAEQTEDPCKAPIVTDPTAIIDDFEDSDANLPEVDGRNGSWWSADDGTPGGTVEPDDDIIPERLLPARCESQRALRFSGQGFDDWGALVGVSFAYAPNDEGEWTAVPHAASEHRGVRFWARIGDTSADLVQFSVDGRLLEPAPDPCPEQEPAGDGCSGAFSVRLSGLSTEWKQYEVPFRGLAQHPISDAELDTGALYSLYFSFAPNTIFDFWLDDLAFY